MWLSLTRNLITVFMQIIIHMVTKSYFPTMQCVNKMHGEHNFYNILDLCAGPGAGIRSRLV